jgi:hypothetical protein
MSSILFLAAVCPRSDGRSWRDFRHAGPDRISGTEPDRISGTHNSSRYVFDHGFAHDSWVVFDTATWMLLADHRLEDRRLG